MQKLLLLLLPWECMEIMHLPLSSGRNAEHTPTICQQPAEPYFIIFLLDLFSFKKFTIFRKSQVIYTTTTSILFLKIGRTQWFICILP